jgi:hypothetical protein
MTYETARAIAAQHLETFTRDDYNDVNDYNRLKAYRHQHKRGTLPRGSYERVLRMMGYTKTESWTAPKKPSAYLIDILTD